MKSTIYALATAPGRAGIAVIRVSGPNAVQALHAFGLATIPKPRMAVYHHFTDPKGHTLLDRGLVLWFPAPHSFTGENTVEFHIHGSHAVILSFLRVLSAIPEFCEAGPGEFSRRAFENGKMDLTQAEGLADLIEAETELQQRQALRQMEGELKNLYESWRHQIIHLSAFLEAYIDFPDEDLPLTLIEQLRNNAHLLLEQFQLHLEDNSQGERMRGGITIAIIGAPNVGKSSLINSLAKKDVAIVSPLAGTTRDTIEAHVNLGGYPVIFIDTAGIRDSTDSIEQEGIRRTLQKAKTAEITLILSEGLERDPALYKPVSNHSIYVYTKSDIYNYATFLEDDAIAISIKTPTHIDRLLEKIRQVLDTLFIPLHMPALTRERHRTLINRSCESLKTFSMNLKNEVPYEILAEDLRLSQQALAEITGKIDVDAVLDELFRNFCIGK